jgi:hypothetical protein
MGREGMRLIHSPNEINGRIIYAISYFFDRALETGLIEAGSVRGSVRVRDYYLAAQRICGEEGNGEGVEDKEMGFGREVRRERRRRRKRRAIERDQDKDVDMDEGTSNQRDHLLEDNPFLCLDLNYISALLHSGYGLMWNKELRLVSQLNGIETSWSLGAALDLLHFQ